MKTKRSGFTLVEILIVVVILGILAAIVIPQFSDASTKTKDASLRADLSTIRSQIELYKVQHSGVFPLNLPGGGTATFTEAMEGITNAAGAITVGGAYGPYLQSIPTNPHNDLATILEEAVDGSGGNTTGWHFNNVLGTFQAESTGHEDL